MTADHLILQRGVLGGSQKYEVPVTDFRRVAVNYGWFGRSLGYQRVDVVLRGGGKASMTYVPTSVGVSQRVERMMMAAGISPDRPEDLLEPEEQPPETS